MKNIALFKKGFTLVELLVVIAIIGILSSVVITSLNSARIRARDAKRVSDINQIRLSLEMYQDANSKYPTAIDSANLGPYLSLIPVDPSTLGSYLYAYSPLTTPTYYHLGATLESANDSALSNDKDCNSTSGANCPQPSAYSGAIFNGADAKIYDVTN